MMFEGQKPGKEWFTPAEIVAAKSPELPGSVQKLNALAVAWHWRSDPAKARRAERRDRGWEYHLSLLPPGAQARLALLHRGAEIVPAPAGFKEASKAAWARFEALPAKQKDEARRRLGALETFERHCGAGRTSTAAAALTATSFDVSSATIFNWRKLVAGTDRADWLPALAPDYRPTTSFSECHESAWEALTSDWLRPERPSFSSCYRRVSKLAAKQGWRLPSERALRRRLEAEVPQGVVLLAREGREKAKRLYPHQTRSRIHFHALQAVNMDGHKLDVFVRLGDGRIVRVHLVAMQDLFSGKIVGWRLSETESKDAVRSVIGDVVGTYGIPEKCWLDNGRSFASKWITGGMATRFRFKVKAEEPSGILSTLGVDVRWTTPYHGQAKPIERAFRDLADNIAKHPFCAGAYTGNRPDAKPENYGNAAIPFDEFRAFVAEQIADHNARAGRKAAACGGRSFDETFAASIADPATIITQPTEAQRSLWLLAAESMRADRGSGEVRIAGNRYWSRELNQHAGQRVTVRFDPDRLHAAVKVYTLDDRLICEAACIQATGFDDSEAARTYLRDRKAHAKAVAEQLRLHRKMSADELARLYRADRPASPAAPAPRPKVARLATGGARPAPEIMSDEEFQAALGRGLQALSEDAEIIPFQPKRSEGG